MTIVRNDWDFPSGQGSPNDTPSALSSREPLSWRLRDDGSEDELDHLANTTSPSKKRTKNDPYRFESPDAVADYVQERQSKRRKVLHEQMQWNHGLANWTRQRDAWTGASWNTSGNTECGSDLAETEQQQQSLIGIALSKGEIPDSSTATSPETRSVEVPTADESRTPSDSASPDGTSVGSLEHSTTAITAPNSSLLQSKAATTTSTTKAALRTSDISRKDATTGDRPGPYIPVYPPLLPEDNVLRSRISPATYGTIYSKIVVQSLTPNIPIPLPDMVRALVHGWKAEGQWPPTMTPDPTSAAARRRGGAGGAFAKWRKERTLAKAGGAGVLGGDGGEVVGGNGHGQQGHRVRRSISSAVKRALGKEGVEERRASEVGLTLGFEEDDEEGGGFGGEGVEDRKLNQALLDGELGKS
jgi:hypothetical protein